MTLKDQPCMAILTPFDLNPDNTTRHYVTINLWLTQKNVEEVVILTAHKNEFFY